ncbi:serine/threonine-protein kinase [Microbispora siamensis]
MNFAAPVVARNPLNTQRSERPHHQPGHHHSEAAQQVASFCTARIVDHDLGGERPSIVTEAVPGPSLCTAVQEEAPLSGDPLHRLALGMATAVAVIHQANVVHRDLKPENVLLGPDGARVIDFGVAPAPGLSLTSIGELAGTPMYMAQELFSGGRAEPAADVFAWGAVVLFAATGRDAFTAPTTLRSSTACSITPPTSIGAGRRGGGQVLPPTGESWPSPTTPG